VKYKEEKRGKEKKRKRIKKEINRYEGEEERKYEFSHSLCPFITIQRASC
jgi:hypothetical protein